MQKHFCELQFHFNICLRPLTKDVVLVLFILNLSEIKIKKYFYWDARFWCCNVVVTVFIFAIFLLEMHVSGNRPCSKTIGKKFSGLATFQW